MHRATVRVLPQERSECLLWQQRARNPLPSDAATEAPHLVHLILICTCNRSAQVLVMIKFGVHFFSFFKLVIEAKTRGFKVGFKALARRRHVGSGA